MANDLSGQAPIALPSPETELASSEQELLQRVERRPDRWDLWFRLGMLASSQGRHAHVVEYLGHAATLAPDQVEVHHHLAASHQALGRRAEAVEHFHRVVCLRPEVPEAHNNWGIALAQQGHHLEAVAAFTQALQLRPDYAEAHNNWGILLFEQKRYDEAILHFRHALASHPHFQQVHNNLGMALNRLGRHPEALSSFQEATRLDPRYAEAHHNLANLHRDRGRLNEAAACYRLVLDLQAEHRDARFQLAIVLARQGQMEAAIGCLHQCLLFHPDSPEVYNNLGILLTSRNRLDEAVAAFRHALRLRPEDPEALNNLGNVLLSQHKGDEAIRCFQQALDRRPDYPQPHCNLGTALLRQGKPEEAIKHYQEALRLQPEFVDALFNLGNAYRKSNRLTDAAGCYQQVLRLQPDNLNAQLKLGVALSEQGRHDEATEVFQTVLRQSPNLAHGHNSLGVTRLHQGRIQEGLAHFEDGLRLAPEEPEIHLNRALTWLLLGKYEEGWIEYEWRWKLEKATPCPYVQPTWDGSAMPGGTILLWAEQGLGDTLQFVRYLPLVKERVGTVLLDCQGPLRGLLASCPGVDGLVGAGAPLPPFDVQAPLLSLPRILGTTLQTIPASVPYLFADASSRERWREKIGTSKGLKVGLYWQGNPQFAGDRHRSVRLEKFRPLAEVPGVQLFSLQKGKGSEQIAQLGSAGFPLVDLGSQITADFRDTAAAIRELDLVISVDTAVAHLTGALGVPLWVLLPFHPDWRWLREREDSLWYPGARLFRQSRWGDWDEVLKRVAGALHHQALRPLQQRLPVQMGLADLVEGFVREKVQHGHPGPCSAALRDAGVLDRPEVGQCVARLEAVLGQIQAIHEEMFAASSGRLLRQHAAKLIRRLGQANRDKDEVLSAFSAWLAAGAAPASERQTSG